MSAKLVPRLTMLAGAVLTLSLAGCSAYAPSGHGTSALRSGQESTLHTPQGETGTPHGHGSTLGAPGTTGYDPQYPGNAIPAQPMGQENSQHAPQGETGSPHGH